MTAKDVITARLAAAVHLKAAQDAVVAADAALTDATHEDYAADAKLVALLQAHPHIYDPDTGEVWQLTDQGADMHYVPEVASAITVDEPPPAPAPTPEPTPTPTPAPTP